MGAVCYAAVVVMLLWLENSFVYFPCTAASTVNPDGTASFELPRAEVGQGITTAVAMTIADEMDLPIDKVKVTLSDARRELIFNQLTGGSNSMHSIFGPVRTAAAPATPASR